MEYKDFALTEIKVHTEKAGGFAGQASVFGVVDLLGDVVMPGAFTRTLAERGPQRPVLSQHDPSKSLGLATLEQREQSLDVTEGQLNLDLLDAQQEHIRLKSGLISGLSIGFKTPRGGDVFEDGVRKLVDVDLWEVSLVTFPANPLATVTNVKSLENQLESLLKADSTVLTEDNVKRALEIAEQMVAERKSLDTLVEALRAKLEKSAEPSAEEVAAAEKEEADRKAAAELEGQEAEDNEVKAALEGLLKTIREE